VHPLSSPTYAAGALYMLRTYRDSPSVLAGAMVFWIVRASPRRGTRASTRRASTGSASSRPSRRTWRCARPARRVRGSVRVPLPERPHTCRPADARVTGAIPRLACPSVSRERTMAPRRTPARRTLRAFEPGEAPDDVRAPPGRRAEACVLCAPTAHTRVAALTPVGAIPRGVWLRPRLAPEMRLRGARVDDRRRHTGQLG
jgi:hypothetical protein